MEPERLRPDRLRQDINRLAASDAALRAFGADEHRYRLASALPRCDVEAFERAHLIRLPEDYVTFLTEVGNGGAGPYYGVFPLGEDSEGRIGDMARPFPFVEAWDQQAQEARGVQSPWVPTNGAVPIAHEGCGIFDWLVVTGSERGHVWQDGTTEHQGWWPWKGERGRRVSFVEWYATWLDCALAGRDFVNPT